jgi:hypothetical protein
MISEDPIVNDTYTLEKFPGKGGWTYALLPHLTPNKKNPFGWLTVKGFIDSYELKQYKLMPMGNGKLFLPVKASTRKLIQKQAGDQVKIVLYLDDSLTDIPEEFLLCLKDEPNAYENFIAFTDSEKKTYIDWIYSVKTETKKIERMAEAINKIIKNEKLK